MHCIVVPQLQCVLAEFCVFQQARIPSTDRRSERKLDSSAVISGQCICPGPQAIFCSSRAWCAWIYNCFNFQSLALPEQRDRLLLCNFLPVSLSCKVSDEQKKYFSELSLYTSCLTHRSFTFGSEVREKCWLCEASAWSCGNWHLLII